MTEKTKPSGANKSAAVLALLSMAVALIPGIGWGMWFLGGPVALIIVILSIVMLAKGETANGIVGLLLALVVPIWCFAAPLAIAVMRDAKAKSGEASPSGGGDQSNPGGNAPPRGTTVSDAIAEAVAEPDGLTGLREWKSSDGRKMRAALVDVVRGADGKFNCRFLRADGREFDLPLGKLSPQGIADVKAAMIAGGLWHEGGQ